MAVGIQGTLIEVAYHIAVAFESSIMLEQIEGIVIRSLASFIVEVVVHQDLLVLMLELKLVIEIQPEFKLNYVPKPYCSFVREYQRLASMVLPE